MDGTLDTPRAEAWIRTLATAVAAHEAELTALHAAIGDGDHGSNLRRGFDAVLAALGDVPAASPGALLTTTGSTLISRVGGASGPLYGSAFRAVGHALATPDEEPGSRPPTGAQALAAALAEGLAAVQRLGGAQPGDKTMVDAFAPAVDAFRAAAGSGTAAAAQAAATAARKGADATVPLVARKGRASYLGPRSAGHLDPGAVSTALLFEALAEACRED
ncbi:dihydroxyacetone kinase subunit DhaL [Kitasatospora sp. NPDC059571]|uniref:dihydroxyacetone kinase subunit DhaL n=1 Tax=Kitasatospora sp. NPDC059571 TaxID=3346871 RepID=UPI00368BF1A6